MNKQLSQLSEGLGSMAVSLQHDRRGAVRRGPFDHEKPLYSISAENIEQHKEQLTAGEIAMLEKFPQLFRIDIYVSPRDLDGSDRMQGNAGRNALSTAWVTDKTGALNADIAAVDLEEVV